MSVYATALNGLQAQSRAVQQYAQDLIGSTTSAAAIANHSAAPTDIVSFSDTAIDAIIGLGVAEENFKANAAVIRTMSDMEDALLDIIA